MNGFGNFTARAQRAIQLAAREADRFNHPYIGTEHLLLGLVALGEGVAVEVLEDMGIALDDVMTGHLIYQKALEHKVGTWVQL